MAYIRLSFFIALVSFVGRADIQLIDLDQGANAVVYSDNENVFLRECSDPGEKIDRFCRTDIAVAEMSLQALLERWGKVY